MVEIKKAHFGLHHWEKGLQKVAAFKSSKPGPSRIHDIVGSTINSQQFFFLKKKIDRMVQINEHSNGWQSRYIMHNEVKWETTWICLSSIIYDQWGLGLDEKLILINKRNKKQKVKNQV